MKEGPDAKETPMPSITPSLWFDHNLEEAAQFYTSVFPNSRIEGFNRYTEAGPGEPGPGVSGTFLLDGTRFIRVNGSPEIPLIEAASFTDHCHNQDKNAYHYGPFLDRGGAPPPARC